MTIGGGLNMENQAKLGKKCQKIIEETIIDGVPIDIELPNKPIILFLIKKIAELQIEIEKLDKKGDK